MRRFVPLVALLLLVIAGALWAVSVRSASSTSGATSVGFSYAQQYMMWQQGPHLVSSRATRLSHLARVLRAAVPARVASDVNVPDLIRRFGPDRQVDLVVVAGTYNTLPPDEGENVYGDAVVLVDIRTKHVLLLDT